MALLDIQGVTRRFGDFTAVDNVSLAIEAGEFFTLLGPSGCGKTTLLRMIAGFDLPDGGRILLNGEDLADRPPEARPVRTVFQVNYIAPVGVPYDVAPDGQHFIFATYPESVSTPMVLVANWTAELKK